MAGVPNLPPHTTTVVGSMEVDGRHEVNVAIRYWHNGKYGDWIALDPYIRAPPFQLRLTGSSGYQGQEGDR